MATSPIHDVVQHLRKTVLREGAVPTDGQLLEHFIQRREAAALEVLVRRHGAMVWGVCRRVLRNHHDAEDAFQATFLVLVRKAASVVPREMVANWLYGAAHQTALKARATAFKRRGRERQVMEMPEPKIREAKHAASLQSCLDEELTRLPDKYRAAIVLCDLEGKTRKEAARQLGLAEGTVASRLARARMLLARRLTRHGLGLLGGGLTAALSQSAASGRVPPAVVSSTIQAATLVAAGQTAAGVFSPQVVALTEGVLKTMLVTKLKSVTVVFLILGLAVGVLGFGSRFLPAGTLAAEEPAPKKDAPAPRAARELDKARSDKELLQGTWRIVSWIDGGKEKDGPDKPVGEWTFKDTTLRMRQQPKDKKTGTTIEFFSFRLDESASPKCFDVVNWEKDFDDVDAVLHGVYSLKGDTLMVCLSGKAGNSPSSKEGDRPTALESKTGSDLQLITLRKGKQETPPPKEPGAAPDAGKDQPAWANKLFEAREKDFGTCEAGELLKHRFPIKNLYSVPLEIREVRVVAGCVTASVSREYVLQPGETGYVEVSMDTRRFVGRKTVEVFVSVGPDYTSTATLIVKANVKLTEPPAKDKQETHLSNPEGTSAVTDVYKVNARKMRIPVSVNRADLKELRLLASTDQGKTWQAMEVISPKEDHFTFEAPKDGLYWLIVQSVRRDGQYDPSDLSSVRQPCLKILVMTDE